MASPSPSPSSSSSSVTPDPKTLDPISESGQEPASRPDSSAAATAAVTEAGGETAEEEEGEEDEEEEGECGFCLFMKAGGCKEEFVAWEQCVEAAEKSGEDVVDKCFEVTSLLKKCMDAHADYYAPILSAEQAMADAAASAAEDSAAASGDAAATPADGAATTNSAPDAAAADDSAADAAPDPDTKK